VLVVVAMNLRVAFEADGYCVVNHVGTALCCWNNMISLNLYAAVPMADAASPMAFNQEPTHLVPGEATRHDGIRSAADGSRIQQ
jgi:hypothetical protein